MSRTKTTPETRLRDRVRQLESILQNWPSVLLEDEVWRYIEALSALHHLAHANVRRPDDLGGNISGNHAQSRAPSYNVKAQVELKAQKAHLRQMAGVVRAVCNEVDPEVVIKAAS